MGILQHVKSNPVADMTGTVTVLNSAGATTTMAATDLVRPADWNSAHAFTQQISGNTLGQSSMSGTNLVFQGGNNITLSATTNAGAATIVISGPNQGTLRFWSNNPAGGAVVQQASQSTWLVFPFQVECNVHATYMRFLSSVSLASSTWASSSTTMSLNVQETVQAVLYSQGTGANSSRLESMGSTSHSIAWSAGHTFTAGSSQTFNMGYTYYEGTDSKTLSASYTTVSSQIVMNTTAVTVLTGVKMAIMPGCIASLSPGNYWLAVNTSTTFTTGGGNMSAVRIVHSHYGITALNATVAPMGVANSSSYMMYRGIGSATTAGGGSMSAIPFPNISSSASHVIPLLSLGNDLVY